MALVAGIDSSTQSCKVVIRDADTGAVVRTGRATHPTGTEVPPDAWWAALLAAVSDAGGLDDVAALSIGGQQHGMVCLDDLGDEPIERTPTRGRLLKDLDAFGIGFDGALDRVDLADQDATPVISSRDGRQVRNVGVVPTLHHPRRKHMNPRSSNPTSEGDSRRIASAFAPSHGRTIARDALTDGGPATR